ncbi:MAG: cysteine--tRNA ligase [Candidatus Shikimatogenerans bostrichidophilus]|nr:MAG: cysteine--tRNA ligase [Candidatus Shikimatogenerans bostrichidophilus]
MKNIINKIKKNILIFNSLNNKKEKFIPIIKNNIGMYVCGPTMYNNIHLGNCRTLIFFDLLYRYFKHLKFKIKYIRNITDIDHLELNKNNFTISIEIIQKKLINFYFTLKKLNLLFPNIEPRSTCHIIEQIENIKKIIKSNLCYIKNGSIYLNIKKYNKKFGNYGNILNNIKLNNEIIINNKFKNEKKNFYDFAIWINRNIKYTIKWKSPWGLGVPGWHIGCSTISNKYLGSYFDIHGGGIDLKFPHHECEISQCNIINNNKNNLAKYWIHTNMLTINNKKMSKSLNNYINPYDLIKGKLKITNYKKINPMIIRLYILQTHYRNNINFCYNSIIDTKKKYKKLFNIFYIIKKIKVKKKTSYYINIKNIYLNCYNSINNDFNIPLLIYNIFKIKNILIKCLNNELQITLNDLLKLKNLIKIFIINILGLKKKKKKIKNNIIKKILKIRNEMRKNKMYYYSDKLRKIFKKYFNINDIKIK